MLNFPIFLFMFISSHTTTQHFFFADFCSFSSRFEILIFIFVSECYQSCIYRKLSLNVFASRKVRKKKSERTLDNVIVIFAYVTKKSAHQSSEILHWSYSILSSFSCCIFFSVEFISKLNADMRLSSECTYRRSNELVHSTSFFCLLLHWLISFVYTIYEIETRWDVHRNKIETFHVQKQMITSNENYDHW